MALEIKYDYDESPLQWATIWLEDEPLCCGCNQVNTSSGRCSSCGLAVDMCCWVLVHGYAIRCPGCYYGED